MLPVVQLDSKGLYTYPNQLSQVPPGAMSIAQNVVVDRPGVVETRRGFDFYGTVLPSDAIKGFVFDQRLLWLCSGGELVYDSDGDGTWVTYSGSFSPPTDNFMNATQANGNFYFTTNNGVYKLDSLTGTPRQAGGPPGLDVTTTLGTSDSGTAIINDSQVAYSLVWGYIDANENLILGAPTEWNFVVNSSGDPQDITVETSIPAGVTTSYFVQVYRTAGTTSATITPGNTFQLATQYTPDNTDLSNGYVSIIDTTPDSLLGAYLYTADGQPANLANTPPPLALDICTYNAMTFYMNFTTLQQATVTLAGTDSPNGLQEDDTITITDIGGALTRTYTAKSSNDFANQEFEVVTSGSISVNIDTTARNLCSAINQDPGNTLWYAFYQTGTNVLPGGIIIQARDLQTDSFAITSSRAGCWTPNLPTSGTTYASANNSSPGSFMVSKPSQPEAVPVAYTVPIQSGNVNVQIYRGLALQDALYLFTTAGVFRVSGTDPTSLQVILFDSSALLIGLQTPQILNNSIYYYSTQGICSVSSGGNQIVSRNIERDVLALTTLSNFTSIAFGTPYESDRKYFLFAPANSTETISTQQYVYNWITQAFTTWTLSASAAIVNQADQHLYVADGDGNVFQERKNFNNLDYSDQQYSITIDSVDTSTDSIVLSDSSDVMIGDVIQQTVGAQQYSAQVIGNTLASNTIQVDDATGFAAGSADSFRSIPTFIEYAAITCGFPLHLKRVTNWKFAFSNANFSALTLSFSSDIYTIEETATLSPVVSAGWGTEPGGWGSVPWGVAESAEQYIPCNPSLSTAYAHFWILSLSLTEAFTSLSLDGIMCTFDIASNRGR